MRWPGRGQRQTGPPSSKPRAPDPPALSLPRTSQAAELEEMLGDVAVTVARLRAEDIEPRAVAVRSGALDGVTAVLGLPVVRLEAGSPVRWGVVV